MPIVEPAGARALRRRRTDNLAAMTDERAGCRIPVLYLAPWVDFGGTDKGTIDWFRWLDRRRFAPSLITTQPSENRRLSELYEFADEVWALPDLFAGPQFPQFIFDFIHTRRVRVLHIMNSRLAYELLPDLAALSQPPQVVVQLHEEEPDRSGYVRYVTTRYGNVVDAFSVTSRHLAAAVEGYDVPRSKIHVIFTGVDALGEFSPEHVPPLDRPADGSTFRILFAGRLVEAKDPLLMLSVLELVAARHDQVALDVVGDGPLEAQVKAEVQRRGLDRRITFHPPSAEIARWLKSSDLLLMTSVFEGVPFMLYEALAMGLPVVAPALPGAVELIGENGGVLVAPRDDADGYASAICRLIDDEPLRSELARGGRERMLESFPVAAMAAAHERVYEQLVAAAPQTAEPAPAAPPAQAPLTFADRPRTGRPLVSVITPCLDHGRYLDGLLQALDAQDYPELELIIVDDASTDPETLEVLGRIEREGRARVLRQEPNSGPSVARNRAIDVAAGRYILPVDADNLLLPGAVSALVEQLQTAGERVGFIYPMFEYFGTRDHLYVPPDYNEFLLMQGNFADTCSLLDRAIFDAGLSYAQDVPRHEDWDLALALAARGVIGEPSREPVMRYRKQGFTRSDYAANLRPPIWRLVQDRHPELFGGEDALGAWGRYRGPAIEIKARWCPALSVVALDPVEFESDAGEALLRGLREQSCRDVELIIECPAIPDDAGCVVRQIPPGLCDSLRDRAQKGLTLSRGRYLLLSSVPGPLLADRSSVEKLVRGFAMNAAVDAIALTNLRADGGYPFRPIERLPAGARAHTVAWRQELHELLPDGAAVPAGAPAADVADFLQAFGAQVYWRHFPGSRSHGPRPGSRGPLMLGGTPGASESAAQRKERDLRLAQRPVIPAVQADCVMRWTQLPTWMPAGTLPLTRHRETGGERRVVTNERISPAGFELEFDLGSIQEFAPPGTARLIRRDGRFETVCRGTERDPGHAVLGYLEQSGLPLFAAVARVTLPDGTETLALDSDRDPLQGLVRPGDVLGFIEAFPIEPEHAPGPTPRTAASLVRRIDRSARRHRYEALSAADQIGDPSALSAELGVLLKVDGRGRIALWLDGLGRLGTDRCPPVAPEPGLKRALNWAQAPVSRAELGARSAAVRAVARRLWDVVELARADHRDGATEPSVHHVIGYLHGGPGRGRAELFTAMHPVLDDQLVTLDPHGARRIGYEHVSSLGFIEARAPLTGALGGRGVAIPWASSFGLLARGA